MTRKKRIERIINSILRALTITTIGIIALAVLASLSQAEVINLKINPSWAQYPEKRIYIPAYQGDIDRAFLLSQDMRNLRFTFIDATVDTTLESFTKDC